jgi:hypothetical protein
MAGAWEGLLKAKILPVKVQRWAHRRIATR